MKTKNGIELNLEESNYNYEFKSLKFYFSSELYKNKFKEQLQDYLNIETMKIYNKYKILIDLSEYLAVALYKKIEKRGFLVYYGNVNLKETYFCNLIV